MDLSLSLVIAALGPTRVGWPTSKGIFTSLPRNDAPIEIPCAGLPLVGGAVKSPIMYLLVKVHLRTSRFTRDQRAGRVSDRGHSWAAGASLTASGRIACLNAFAVRSSSFIASWNCLNQRPPSVSPRLYASLWSERMSLIFPRAAV